MIITFIIYLDLFDKNNLFFLLFERMTRKIRCFMNKYCLKLLEFSALKKKTAERCEQDVTDLTCQQLKLTAEFVQLIAYLQYIKHKCLVLITHTPVAMSDNFRRKLKIACLGADNKV